MGDTTKNGNSDRIVFIEVQGEKIRPKDGYWVVFNPNGQPVDFFSSDTSTRDNVSRACREYWKGDTPAIEHLNSGYHLRLVTKSNFMREVAPNLVDDETPATLRTGKRA